MLQLLCAVLVSQSPTFQPVADVYGLGGLGLRGEAPNEKVFVHIDSDRPSVRLYRNLGSTVGTVATTQGTATMVVHHYSDECSAPCDVNLKPGRDQFYLAGEGVTPSEAFSLSDKGAGVNVKVKAGSALTRWAGSTLAVMGVTGALVGGSLLLVNSLVYGSSSGAANPYGAGSSPVQTAGVIGLVAGGVGLAGGIPLIAFSGTKVEFLPLTAPGDSQTSGPAPGATEL